MTGELTAEDIRKLGPTERCELLAEAFRDADDGEEPHAETLAMAEVYAATARVLRDTDRRQRGPQVNDLLWRLVTLGKLISEAALTPCPCDGKRWVDDENWQPDQDQLRRGREPADGLIPCGFCNEGGWDVPVGGGS